MVSTLDTVRTYILIVRHCRDNAGYILPGLHWDVFGVHTVQFARPLTGLPHLIALVFFLRWV